MQVMKNGLLIFVRQFEDLCKSKREAGDETKNIKDSREARSLNGVGKSRRREW